jgi:FkbM family methyltransferase
LRNYVDKLDNSDRVILFNKGVSDKTGRVFFESTGDTSARISEVGSSSIEVITIDEALQEYEFPVEFIKMDIEGAELAALHGAKETIQKYKPILAICVYHKLDDLITIPQYIKKLVPEYKLYLRHHSKCIFETVLYAVK